MIKGVSIKFKSYKETVPQLLKLIKLGDELKKHDKIVLKPYLGNGSERATNAEFIEPIINYCVGHKNPGSEIFIAEGCDGYDTLDAFEEKGYKALAEKYGVGLIDLNKAECEEIFSSDFASLTSIQYPTILKESFVISLPALMKHESATMIGALSNMRGAYPSKYYRGLLSSRKNKLGAHSIKNQIHDIVSCKMPDFALIDASEAGAILAGKPFEIDKQGAKLLGLDWRSVEHLRLLHERIEYKEKKEALIEETNG